MSNTTSTAFRAPIKEQTITNIDLTSKENTGISLSDTKDIIARVENLEQKLISLEEDFSKLGVLVQELAKKIS